MVAPLTLCNTDYLPSHRSEIRTLNLHIHRSDVKTFHIHTLTRNYYYEMFFIGYPLDYPVYIDSVPKRN